MLLGGLCRHSAEGSRLPKPLSLHLLQSKKAAALPALRGTHFSLTARRPFQLPVPCSGANFIDGVQPVLL